jgi:Trypsin-co-occurring domain 1
VEFGLKFTASGGVIIAGIAGEASLAVTLGWDVNSRPGASEPAAPAPRAGLP